MNPPVWVLIAASAGTDFLIVAGTTLMGAMVATSTAQIPAAPVWLLAAIGGIVAAGKELRAQLKLPPAEVPSPALPGQAVKP